MIGVENPTVMGSCNSTSSALLADTMAGQYIMVTFENGIMLHITFGADDDNVWWDSVSVSGSYIPYLFPNASKRKYPGATHFKSVKSLFV